MTATVKRVKGTCQVCGRRRMLAPAVDGNRLCAKCEVFAVLDAEIEAEDLSGDCCSFCVWECPKCGATNEPTTDGGCTACSNAPVDFSQWGRA